MIPVIRPVVLSLRSPEFFMLTIFGIAMISTFSTGSVLKAWIMGVMGLLCSTVGLEDALGVTRYTFGILYLWDGLKIIPIVIGLFAIAEMMDLTARGAVAISEKVQKIDNFMDGFKDVFHHWWLVLRCGALGALLGAVPGLAGDSINFIAYGHAKQTSKIPEEFGKGAIEGVIGPESANNAKEGGILLPTLALGIPGAASMAILLSTFEVWGIVTGPTMLKQNLSMVFLMVFAIVWGNIIGAGFCFPLSVYAVRLTNLRTSLLVPGILVFAIIGAFASANSMGDITMALIFGIVGFFMKKLRYQRPVFMIGIVLGGIAERYLNLSMRLYSYKFLLRPITILIMIFITLVVFLPLLLKTIKNRRAGTVREKAPDTSKLLAEKIVAFVLLSFFAVSFFIATRMPAGANRIPFLMSGAGLLFAAGGFIKVLKVDPFAGNTGAADNNRPPFSLSFLKLPEVRLFFWLVLFLAMIYFIGFAFAIALFLFLVISFFYKERFRLAIGAAAAGLLLYYGLFVKVVGIQTFDGILFSMF